VEPPSGIRVTVVMASVKFSVAVLQPRDPKGHRYTLSRRLPLRIGSVLVIVIYSLGYGLVALNIDVMVIKYECK